MHATTARVSRARDHCAYVTLDRSFAEYMEVGMGTGGAPERGVTGPKKQGSSISEKYFSTDRASNSGARDVTSRQRGVLQAIHAFVATNGCAPSVREIARAIGCRSTNGVVEHLSALEMKGMLVRGRGLARSIAITTQGLAILGSPPPPARSGVVARSAPRVGPGWLRGCVYFIEAVGCDRFKIGFTKGSPDERRQLLQTACPFPLRVVGAIRGTARDESALHAQFASDRVMPNAEWFFGSNSLLAFFAERGFGDRRAA